MEYKAKVRGDFMSLVMLHNELIRTHEKSKNHDYRGISIKRAGPDYILEYKIIDKNNTHGQTESYRRSEFFNAEGRLSEMWREKTKNSKK